MTSNSGRKGGFVRYVGLWFGCFLLVGLGGCIPVEDLGPYWAKGIIDPDLEGNWQRLDVKDRTEVSYVSFKRAKGYFLYDSKGAGGLGAPPLNLPTRTLVLGKHKFLMQRNDPAFAKDPGKRDPAWKSNNPLPDSLVRYTLKNGVLTVYVLNENVLSEAVKAGKVRGKLSKPEPKGHDPAQATLAVLDARTVKFIVGLADNPKNWTRTFSYTQVKDPNVSRKVFRKHPATQKVDSLDGWKRLDE